MDKVTTISAQTIFYYIICIFLFVVTVCSYYVDRSGSELSHQDVRPVVLGASRYRSETQIPYTVGMTLIYDYPDRSKVDPLTNETIGQRHFTLDRYMVDALDQLYSLNVGVPDNSNYDWNTLPMVIGASGNHYREALAAVDAHHRMFPNNVIYYYDLGLTSKQVKSIKLMCNVEYRKLDFDRYPPHIRNLHNYAFKALVWFDMLLTHERFLWMDASIRLGDCFVNVLQNVSTRLEHSGVMMLHRALLPVYATTAPSLYEYLGANVTKMLTMPLYGGGMLMFQRNKQMIDDIMRWLVICSLDESCAEPRGSQLHCEGWIPKSFIKDFVMPYMNCHRYDMCILGILQANSFDYDLDKYAIPEVDPCFSVMREDKPDIEIPQCGDEELLGK